MKIKNDKIVIQITCLVISIVLWMFIMVETNPPQEGTITNIPITIKNYNALEKANLVMMNSDKDNLTVSVRVKGSIDQISKLNKNDFSASIDVLGLSEGITNTKIEVDGPSGVEIINIYPSQIACKIEGIISKVMDVTVQFEGNPAKDYIKSTPSPNPTSVKITGPRSVVNSAALAVATVNIEQATEDVVKTVPVRVYDDTNTEIFMSAPIDNVQVSVPIYPTKYVELKPTVIGTPEEGYQLTNVSIKPNKVRIAARKEILDTINELKVEDLDITGAYNNILSSREILGTDGLIILDLNNAPVVNVEIEKIVEKEFVILASEIKFTNLKADNELNLATLNEEIKVTVIGPESKVNKLKKNDLILTADLAKAVPGYNDVNIELVTDLEFNSITLSQETIRLEILESHPETVNDEE